MVGGKTVTALFLLPWLGTIICLLRRCESALLLSETTEKEPQETMHSVIKKIAVGIATWAVICMAVVLPKSNRIGSTLGGGWASVLFIYAVLFLGGMAILPIFMTLDRITSENKKFAAQMIACLLIAVVVLIGIGIYTF